MPPKNFIALTIFVLWNFHTYPSSFKNFAAGISTLTLRTRTSPTASVKLYNSLHSLTKYNGSITPSVYPLKQILSSYSNQIAHQKIYNIVLTVLSKNPEKLSILIKQQTIKNAFKHEKLIKSSLLLTQQYASKQNNQSVRKQTFQKAIALSSTAHTPVIAKQSTWNKIKHYFMKTPTPTAAQIVYFLAYKNKNISPSEYPLKVVLEQLKKQIPDPELYKKIIISLCNNQKPLLQKLIDNQIHHQRYTLEEKIRRGMEHSKHWLKRYNEGLQDIAASQQSSSPSRLLTENKQPKIIHLQAQTALSQETVQTQKLTTYIEPATATPVVAETKLLAASPSRLLIENKQPKITHLQAQTALNQEIVQTQKLITYIAPATATPVVAETKLLAASPSRLLTENKQSINPFKYILPTTITTGGIYTYISNQNNETESIAILPTTNYKQWFILGAIGVYGVKNGLKIYKIFCDITKGKRSAVLKEEIENAKLTPFDQFVLHHKPMGFTLQFVHQMHLSGYSAVDVQASQILSDDQKANIINLVSSLRKLK